MSHTTNQHLYLETSQLLTKTITQRYSTSFSLATQLFPADIRQSIYNIYALVRLADEVVDTYDRSNRRQLLDQFEGQTYQALEDRYSTNPVIHAFQHTANQYHIGKDLIQPFFTSMRQDTQKTSYTDQQRQDYIYGSAEVVGLMCLKVFCDKNNHLYQQTAPGAQKLGSAFQKVNFLRDYNEDKSRLNRDYLSSGTSLTNKQRDLIIEECRQEFAIAQASIHQLPQDIQPALITALSYYLQLLESISRSDLSTTTTRRIRVPNHQ